MQYILSKNTILAIMSESIFLNNILSSSQIEGEIIYHLNDLDSQNKSIIIKKKSLFSIVFYHKKFKTKYRKR